MSNKHGPHYTRCPWCLRQFDSLHALATHLRATKHDQFIGDQQSAQARKKLQHYHQDKVTSE